MLHPISLLCFGINISTTLGCCLFFSDEEMSYFYVDSLFIFQAEEDARSKDKELNEALDRMQQYEKVNIICKTHDYSKLYSSLKGMMKNLTCDEKYLKIQINSTIHLKGYLKHNV